MMEEEIRKVVLEIVDTCNKINKDKKIDKNDINIIYRKGLENNKHCIQKMNEKDMVVYLFKYKDIYLKIGKAFGKNINNRPNRYHYNPYSCPSNLSKYLIFDDKHKYPGLDTKYLRKIYNDDRKQVREIIKKWMLENLERVDVVMNNKLDFFTLDMFENSLQYAFRPRYEWRDDQHFE